MPVYFIIFIHYTFISDRVNIMVNIFGKEAVRGKEGARGPTGIDGDVGPRGVAGPSGEKGEQGKAGASGIIDLYNWLPHSVLDDFRLDSEEGCFLIIKGDKDVEMKNKNIVKWLSRSLTGTFGSKKRVKKNAVITAGSEPCKKIEYFPDDRGFMGLKKSLFKVDNVCLTNTYSLLCITFKVLGDDSVATVQYIVSNWEKNAQNRVFRGVSASKGEIYIHGCVNADKDYITIKHNTQIWTTLFIEWTEVDGNRGAFDINNGEQKGSFTSKPPTVVLPPSVYIGGRSDNTHYFNGYLSAVEWCSFLQTKDVPFPDAMKKLIIENQYIDDDELPPPPCKVLKIDATTTTPVLEKNNGKQRINTLLLSKIV